MVFFEKSQPAPQSLQKEKHKKSGKYNLPDVLDSLRNDFKNKCYICESKEPDSIQVEHFRPHKGDVELKFDWNNLYWSCAHCNGIKSDKYEKILNCTNRSDNIEEKLKYVLDPINHPKVRIEALNKSDETIMTKQLLDDIYNGTTIQRKLESSNLRSKLIDELHEFTKFVIDYSKDSSTDYDKEQLLVLIKIHLNKSSSFTAFKRWYIYQDENLKNKFKKYCI